MIGIFLGTSMSLMKTLEKYGYTMIEKGIFEDQGEFLNTGDKFKITKIGDDDCTKGTIVVEVVYAPTRSSSLLIRKIKD